MYGRKIHANILLSQLNDPVQEVASFIHEINPLHQVTISVTPHRSSTWKEKESAPPTQNYNNSHLLKNIGAHNFMHIGNERIKPERKSGILSRSDQLRKKVRDHFFCDAETHFDIPQTNTAPD